MSSITPGTDIWQYAGLPSMAECAGDLRHAPKWLGSGASAFALKDQNQDILPALSVAAGRTSDRAAFSCHQPAECLQSEVVTYFSRRHSHQGRETKKQTFFPI